MFSRAPSQFAGVVLSAWALAAAGCASTPWHTSPSGAVATLPTMGGVASGTTNAQKPPLSKTETPVPASAQPAAGEPKSESVIRGQSPGTQYATPVAYDAVGQPRYGMPVSGDAAGTTTQPAPGAPPPAAAYTNQPPYSGYQAPANAMFGAPPPTPVQSQPSTNATAFTPFWPGMGGGAPGAPIPVPGDDLPPARYADLSAILQETETGRFMFGVGVNSDLGLTGQIVIDERNFDITAPPTSWDDVLAGRAFRGNGQGFRIEAMPGTEVQRYMLNFTEPYLFGTNVSFNTSAFYYTRNYYDYDEERIGGNIGLGYRLSPDLSAALRMRAERVNIFNPRVLGVPELDEVIGQNDIYSGKLTLAHDTRDMPFFPTEGHYFELGFEQAFGTFDFPRATLDYRTYRLLHERPDGSGRHSLGYSLRLGFSGAQTPLFENFFAGGYSSLRGFAFRGASPVDNTVIVGGEFQWLNSVEYVFPLTADDMLKGIVFCDFGTVEQQIQIDWNNFRVAPGVGLRINVPAFGPAPIALDFAFPVAMAPTDTKEIFSFFIGVGR